MCFSVQVDQDIRKLSKAFSATINEPAYQQFESLKKLEDKIGQRALLDKLGMIKSRLRKTSVIKTPKEDGIVYSNYFTNIITHGVGGGLQIEPMRYRVRPAGSADEIPSKYNVFNARLDALEKRETWRNIFGKQHGLLVLTGFYEWVERSGQKKIVSFRPKEYRHMTVPCIWDAWKSKDREISFKSFALITKDPPLDVLNAGHDRCPVFLKEEYIDKWLGAKYPKSELINLLLEDQTKHYSCVS